MDRLSTQQAATMPIEFKLNGKTVVGRADELIIETARRHGVVIPHLCYRRGLRPDGNCRACVVEIKGERVLAPACCRYPNDGMEVTSGRPRFAPREQPQADVSHPAIAVNLDACIQCTRCVRACREEQVNDVIGYAFRGDQSKIVFDLDDPMGASTCVACGECVQVCPTGALMPAREVGLAEVDRKVNSVCPYCGVGCLLTYNIKDNKMLYVEGINGPANGGRLCVKGRYGFDYIYHRQRLTRPLIRKPGVPKTKDFVVDPDHWREAFREATWEEALDLAANGLRKIRDANGPRALAGFGSAKGTNEEAYLFQKLVRTGFGSNNVDHCTRLCHASSVAALLEGIGSAAVTATFNECKNSDVIFFNGTATTENHPVAATFFKQ